MNDLFYWNYPWGIKINYYPLYLFIARAAPSKTND